MRRVLFAFAAFALLLSSCVPDLPHGGPPPVADVPKDAPRPPSTRAARAAAAYGAVDELLGAVGMPEHVSRVRAALRDASAGAPAAEAGLLGDLDGLVETWGDVRGPNAMQRLGPSWVARGAELMRAEPPVFDRAADAYPEHALLGARVAMFDYRLPEETQFAEGFTLDKQSASGVSGTIKIGGAIARTDPRYDPARKRMADVVQRFPDVAEVRLLAGRMCALDHGDDPSKECDAHFARCLSLAACKTEHAHLVRALAKARCGKADLDAFALYAARAGAAPAGATAPQVVTLDGKSWTLDAGAFVSSADVARAAEDGFQRTFVAPNNLLGKNSWDPVVRLYLEPTAALRAGEAWKEIVKRGASVIVMKGQTPVAAVPADGPWDAPQFPFFSVSNVDADTFCKHVDRD